MANQHNIPNALFKLDGHHIVKVYLGDNQRAECDTCSLSALAHNAAIFAAENGVFKMTVNGANLVRI